MTRFYLIIGDQRTMETSIKRSLWGFSEKTVGLWNRTQKNDLVAFYVTSPTKKVIGFGRVIDKSVNSEQIWSDEILFKRSIWKYKIHLEIFHIVKDLAIGISIPKGLMLNTGR